MLLFSTILEIRPEMTKDDLIRLVIEWNQGSPHQINVIPGIEWHGEHNIRYGDEMLWLDIQEYRNEDIIAVRYEKQTDDGTIWDTDYIMNFRTRRMAIQLDRSYTPEALVVSPDFSTPHFIKLLVEHGYLQDDGDLPVLDTPVMVGGGELALAADIINGTSAHKLPVVYISRPFAGEDPVDVELLARKLRGVAHVLVQQDTDTYQQLRALCQDQNEYDGAIGIYYPTGAAGPRRHNRFLNRGAAGHGQVLLERVVRSVIMYSNAQMVEPLYTWQGVSNALLRDRLASQKAERAAAEEAKAHAEQVAKELSDSLDEEQKRIRQEEYEAAQREAMVLLRDFDDSYAALQKQVEELARSNEALRAEVFGLRAKLDATDTVPLLTMGVEDDFYMGEIKDQVLRALVQVASMLPRCRQRDVLNDIIQANEYQKLSDGRAEEVKRLLSHYDRMTDPLEQSLKALGLELNKEGQHYKLTYCGDTRYLVTLPKTPSDHRSGKNSASDIARMAF